MRGLFLALICGVLTVTLPLGAPAQTGPEYHVEKNGQQIGPYFVDELKTRVRLGMVRRETLVWSEGMTAWTPAADVPGLQVLFNVALPPVQEPRDFGQFILGTWVSEPVETEVPGLGKGVATGVTVYRPDGSYNFDGQMDATDAQGQRWTLIMTSTGRYTVTPNTSESFGLAFDAPLVITTKNPDPSVPDSVSEVQVPPSVLTVVDDNTVRDDTNNVSRRKR